MASIWHINGVGIFFNEVLIEHIRRHKNDEALKILQNVIAHDQLRDSTGWSLLHCAASYGNIEFALYLISAGADVNTQDNLRRTPLRYAVSTKHVETVKMLLEFNADIFIPDVEGQCALGKAFKNDNWRIVKLLLHEVTVESLSSSVYVASEVFHRDCPLYEFVTTKNVGIIRSLLEKGSPIDAKCPKTGQTALHIAVSQGNLSIIKLLLDYGADVNLKEQNGRTALAGCYKFEKSFITENKRTKEEQIQEIIQTLVGAGANLIDHVSMINFVKGILTKGSRKTIRFLLHCPIDLYFCDTDGMTSLHYIASNCQPNILEELRDFKFDVNIPDLKNDLTMLHYASLARNTSSIKFLLERGADINTRNCIRSTPLNNIACSIKRSRSEGSSYLNCVDILLERGADPLLFIRLLFPQKLSIIKKMSSQLWLRIFDKLAVLEYNGHEIDSYALQQIDSHLILQSLFNFVKVQHEKFKQMEIINSLTLFDFLNNDAKVLRFVCNESLLVENITEAIKQYKGTNVYFECSLQRRLSKFNQLVEWREKMIEVVNQVFNKFCNLDENCNLAKKVVDFLQEEKWRKIFVN